MFELVRAFGFEPDEVVEGSLRFGGVNVEFVTMPGRVPRSFGLSGMNEAQKAAVNALTYPRIVQEDPVTTDLTPDRLSELREQIQRLGTDTALPPDPTPVLCCTHGQQLDTLAAELARANQLLADLVEIRRGKNTPRRPTPDEIVEFARSGTSKRPAPKQGHIVNSPRFLAALEDFRQKYEQGRIDEL